MSNIEFRQGDRTVEKWHSDMTTGIKRQAELLFEFVALHKEKNPECPIKILDCKVNADTTIYENHTDEFLDGKLLLEYKGKQIWRTIEVEAVFKEHKSKAHFKKIKLIRCAKKNSPILNFQMGVFPRVFTVFSASLVKEMVNGPFIDFPPYDYKPAYCYNTMFPRVELTNGSIIDVPQVEWNSLDPLVTYKQVFKNMIS